LLLKTRHVPPLFNTIIQGCLVWSAHLFSVMLATEGRLRRRVENSGGVAWSFSIGWCPPLRISQQWKAPTPRGSSTPSPFRCVAYAHNLLSRMPSNACITTYGYAIYSYNTTNLKWEFSLDMAIRCSNKFLLMNHCLPMLAICSALSVHD
jgi:hypothetical protein